MFSKLRKRIQDYIESSPERQYAREHNRMVAEAVETLVDIHPQAPERSRGTCDIYWSDRESAESSLTKRTLRVGPYFLGMGFDHLAHVSVVGPDGEITIFRGTFKEEGPWLTTLHTLLCKEIRQVRDTGTRQELEQAAHEANLKAVQDGISASL